MWAESPLSATAHHVAHAVARGTWHTSACGMFLDPNGLTLTEEPKKIRCVECLDLAEGEADDQEEAPTQA
jgi:hypothetical protein